MSKKEKKQRLNEKWNERTESIRAYFLRLFGKYDFRDEEQFLYFGKWLIFILLLLVEGLGVLELLADFTALGGWCVFLHFLSMAGVLDGTVATQLFVVKKGWLQWGLSFWNMLLACAFLFFVKSIYSLVFYMLILTQVYYEAKKTKHSLFVLFVSIFLYMLVYAVQAFALHGAPTWNLFELLNLTFGFIVSIVAHFLAVQIALAFYRQYLKLGAALRELDESKRELEKAYAVVAEVSALEERQRIAKEIHDTAGHSLTTVIMQTETAKRLVENNPSEAKGKIIAANLQARHALDEIRDCVHLLSGNASEQNLRMELLNIVHESTDGTGITLRFEIADVQVSSAKHRFLCNTLKEGISNGLRHGNATAFWFELKEEGGRIVFLLSDNGSGVDEEELRLGFGLTTMRERANALGGELTLYSEQGEGFELKLTLPADKGEE